MTDYDITEIADARYMGLMCPPASTQAKALVATKLSQPADNLTVNEITKAKKCNAYAVCRPEALFCQGWHEKRQEEQIGHWHPDQNTLGEQNTLFSFTMLNVPQCQRNQAGKW